MSPEKLPWYVLYVHSRFEKRVCAQLTDMGYETYLPLVVKVKQWSDRTKKVEEPLFKSYLFVRADVRKYFEVVELEGVTRFVSFERKPAVVPENQIVAIKKYCDDFVDGDPEPKEDELHEGQLVRIVSGPMTGLTGRLAPIDNRRRLVVFIESVGRYLPINIARTRVEAIYENEN